MNLKQRLENRIRGWLPQETLLTCKSQTRTEKTGQKKWERKYFRYFLIADAVVMQAFLGVNFLLVNPVYRDGFYSAVWWLGFTLTLVSVNLLLYWRYKQKHKN